MRDLKIVNKELINNTITTNCFSASKEASIRYHLDHDPPKGGRPIMEIAPIKKLKNVIGMIRPRPRISLIFVFFVARPPKKSPVPASTAAASARKVTIRINLLNQLFR